MTQGLDKSSWNCGLHGMEMLPCDVSLTQTGRSGASALRWFQVVMIHDFLTAVPVILTIVIILTY
jgi:hypothetical protein